MWLYAQAVGLVASGWSVSAGESAAGLHTPRVLLGDG